MDNNNFIYWNCSAGTIAHGLDSAPDWIMVKNLDDGSKNWNVYVPDLGNTYLELNNTTSASQVVHILITQP